MNRRELLKNFGLTTVGLLTVPKWALAKVPRFGHPLTIADIMTVSFPAVMNELRRGGHEWVSSELRAATKSNPIRLWTATLAPMVEVLSFADAAKTKVLSKTYYVEEVSIRIAWSKKDEIEADTEAKKIELTKNLIMRAIWIHDDMIVEKLGKGRAVAAKPYCYILGPVTELSNATLFTTKLSTAMAFID